MIKYILITLSLLGFVSNSFGQAPTFPEKRSKEIIDEGVVLHDDSLYQEAIDLYKLISPNDSNYSWALSEMTYSLMKLNSYEEIIKLCEKALAEQNVDPTDIRERLAMAYDENEQSDKALETYKEGIDFAPMSYMLYFNIGITYSQRKEYKKAIESFKKAIEINPKHASSHFQLGMHAFLQGELVPATLAFSAFLMLEPTSSRANQVLLLLNEALSDKIEYEDDDYTVAEGENFKKLEVMVANYIALSSKYKIPVKYKPAILKQMHFIFSKLPVGEEGFFSETYTPFFKQVVNDKNLFKGFSYVVLYTSGNEMHQDLIKKDKSKLIDFYKWANDEWLLLHAVKNEKIDGKLVEVKYWRSKNGSVEGVGQVDAEGNPFGKYVLYHSNGCLSDKGAFNNEGNRTEEWREFYSTGILMSIRNYKNGELYGNYEFYDDDGSLAYKLNYNKDLKDGVRYYYYPTKIMSQENVFEEDKMVGEFIQYFPQGQTKLTAKFEDDKLNGQLIRLYSDGTQDMSVGYKDGERDGDFIEYYDNGNVYGEYSYIEGKLDGLYTLYYRDGQIRRQGTMKEGKNIGEWKSYLNNGSLDYIESFDVDGKQNGVYISYDYTGRKVSEMDYSKGEISGYRMYDENGEIIKNAKAKRGKFLYYGSHANRAKAAEGMFEDGEKIGEWKYYNEYGSLTGTAEYDAGVENGLFKDYADDGKLESTRNYKEGERQGLQQRFYPDSSISQQGRYLNDEKTDRWMNYTPAGKVTEDRFYRFNKLNGWQVYYNNLGQLIAEIKYREGLLMEYRYYGYDSSITSTGVLDSGTGALINNFANGQLSFKMEIENGYFHGSAVGYFPNGKIRYKKAYAYNNLEGDYKYYHLNGKLLTEGVYEKGSRVGEWTNYFENGKKSSVTIYENGYEHGPMFFYNEKGFKTRKYNYSYGEYDGPQYYYSEDGKVQMIRYYNNGILEKYSYLGSNGKEIEPIMIEYGNADVVCKYANGKTSRTFTYKFGEFEGNYKVFHANGKLAHEFENIGSKSQGTEVEYYANGNKYIESQYYYGEKHGIETTYYSNGKVKSTVNFVYGDEEGEAKYYNTKGVLIRTIIWFNGNVHDIQ